MNNSNLQMLYAITIFSLVLTISLILFETKARNVYDNVISYKSIIEKYLVTHDTPRLELRDLTREMYFSVETSHTETISTRVLCSLESVARLHPEADVFLLIVTPPNLLNASVNEILQKLLQEYKNLQINYITFPQYFQNTPLEEWYKSGNLNKSKHLNYHTTDIMRFLTIWKYGGTYLDSDIILTKSLKGVKNFVCAENDNVLGGGIMNFELNHKISGEFLQELIKSYDGNQWAHNGQGLITRVIKKHCSNLALSTLIALGCSDLQVFPQSKFFAIEWNANTKFFDESKLDELMNIWKKSSGVHLWNYVSSSQKIKINSKQPISFLVKENCPHVVRNVWLEF